MIITSKDVYNKDPSHEQLLALVAGHRCPGYLIVEGNVNCEYAAGGILGRLRLQRLCALHRPGFDKAAAGRGCNLTYSYT